MKNKKDSYKEKWIKSIKNISTTNYDEELGRIIDKIYEDGFTDGNGN